MKSPITKFLIFASLVGIVCFAILWIFQSTSTKSIEVFEPAGNNRWPLTVTSGTIYCRWKVLIPESNHPHAKRPLVLFKSKRGIYGVNGAASGVGGYPPIKQIMVEKRIWRFGAPTIISEWIQAGLALCDGDSDKAREAINRAHAKAAEPLPKGFETILRTDTVSANKRRIFIETVRCEDRAIEESFKRHQKRYDELVLSGRKDETYELNRQRLKKESELMASCKSALRHRERLSIEDHKEIMSEGISRGWPLD